MTRDEDKAKKRRKNIIFELIQKWSWSEMHFLSVRNIIRNVFRFIWCHKTMALSLLYIYIHTLYKTLLHSSYPLLYKILHVNFSILFSAFAFAESLHYLYACTHAMPTSQHSRAKHISTKAQWGAISCLRFKEGTNCS